MKFIQPLSLNEALVKDAPTIEDIKKAINSRHLVTIYYNPPNGEAGARLIEPYCLGRGYKSGGVISNKHKLYLRAYVIKDSSKESNTKKLTKRKSVSKTDKAPYWRVFLVKHITAWTDLGKVFSKHREGYVEGDSAFVKVIANLPIDSFPRGEL